MFFTFFGLDAVRKTRQSHIELASVGNPGLHFPTWLGGLPGVSELMTRYMTGRMAKLDIPSVSQFVEMIGDTGAGLYACKPSVDIFGLRPDDFVDQVKDNIIDVGEFYKAAAGGQIVFT